ncbi:HDOD domain-containing protein [Uliginosibacterium sp. sgz301328]|uniref:HDOD domain-containing protein n=1 Tax=Uliginosibacterium sp. sgz301328 TaxID=3243764 RepID=UPI00359DBEF1
MNETTNRRAAFNAAIEKELATGEFVFPTSMQAAVRVRRALDEPEASMVSVARIIGLEPVLSVKLLRMANSTFFNPQAVEVTDVQRALMRVGLNHARTLAIAVIGDQLATALEFAPVWRLAEQLWRHTLEVASLAYAVALQLDGAVRPDTALLAGMVHDIGQFYLLSRVHEFPELLEDDGELSELIVFWHKPVGQAVLRALGTPQMIVDALEMQEIYGPNWPPAGLADVLYLANTASPVPNPFSTVSLDMQMALRESAFEGVDANLVSRLLDEARVQRAAALAMLTA